ncbi:hypothetical protein SADUNF_Sadunf02G0041600 [Salix dunnii]|uniref:Uncharacterized protein n=1 Tax=Salix dunnii TaxID=1413687 RepID=A0A835N603_9ROSI|nr:hypothetical protein SADUNF_Sadunf02G0041600 [Salix dunnii]
MRHRNQAMTISSLIGLPSTNKVILTNAPITEERKEFKDIWSYQRSMWDVWRKSYPDLTEYGLMMAKPFKDW